MQRDKVIKREGYTKRQLDKKMTNTCKETTQYKIAIRYIDTEKKWHKTRHITKLMCVQRHR